MNVSVPFPFWKCELDSLEGIPVLDGVEWDLMRVMDVALSEQAGTVIVVQLSHQEDSAKG
jgi:hypothetical protein